ncbi:MAG TPA: molybdopterin cofactor-binding domain-containing protein [Solirubrobacterales bacterium]|nr:molybdopterin cofactor-binding domain-containing protein [Solirubrobacterales bacterium]
MADGPTYRAVFIRMHPTGKTVLSLSEASQGEEAKLAGVAASELGIPPEDIKVVHEDTDRFGEGNTFNNEPSDAVGENVAITARKLRDKAQIVAASMLDAAPDALRFDNGRWTAEQGDPKGVRIQEVALHTFGGFELPEGIEGSLDAQTTYRVGAVQAAG